MVFHFFGFGRPLLLLATGHWPHWPLLPLLQIPVIQIQSARNME
jgi:hypothetical protein